MRPRRLGSYEPGQSSFKSIFWFQISSKAWIFWLQKEEEEEEEEEQWL